MPRLALAALLLVSVGCIQDPVNESEHNDSEWVRVRARTLVNAQQNQRSLLQNQRNMMTTLQEIANTDANVPEVIDVESTEDLRIFSAELPTAESADPTVPAPNMQHTPSQPVSLQPSDFRVIKYVTTECPTCDQWPGDQLICGEPSNIKFEDNQAFFKQQGVTACPSFDLLIGGKVIERWRSKVNQVPVSPETINAEILRRCGRTSSLTSTPHVPEYSLTIWRDNSPESDRVIADLQQLPNLDIEIRWDAGNGIGGRPYVEVKKNGRPVRSYPDGCANQARIRKAIVCYEMPPEPVIRVNETVVDFRVRQADWRKWTVEGDTAPSWEKLIQHLARAHGRSVSKLQRLTRSQLIALHDDDHESVVTEL